jgi:hypothetical protein
MKMDSRKLYFDKTPIKSIVESLLLYPEEEFCSPTRSTVPLLSLLKDGNRILNTIIDELHLNNDCDLHLEFKVYPTRGIGAASQTDLMLRGRGETLAMEAKWTEPRYDTVAVWSDTGKSPNNKEKVLRGWFDLIQPHTSRILDIHDFSAAVYQMVHRAASAYFTSEHPRLAYLHFIPDPSGMGATSEQYQSDLEDLKDLIGNPKSFSFYLIDVEIKPTSAFEQIMNLPKASFDTAKLVRTALSDTTLYEFTDVHLQAIG